MFKTAGWKDKVKYSFLQWTADGTVSVPLHCRCCCILYNTSDYLNGMVSTTCKGSNHLTESSLTISCHVAKNENQLTCLWSIPHLREATFSVCPGLCEFSYHQFCTCKVVSFGNRTEMSDDIFLRLAFSYCQEVNVLANSRRFEQRNVKKESQQWTGYCFSHLTSQISTLWLGKSLVTPY